MGVKERIKRIEAAMAPPDALPMIVRELPGQRKYRVIAPVGLAGKVLPAETVVQLPAEPLIIDDIPDEQEDEKHG